MAKTATFGKVFPETNPFSESAIMSSVGVKPGSIEEIFLEIKQRIQNFIPSALKIPFPLKQALLLSDQSSFLLLSTHGKVFYLSLGGLAEPEQIDLSSISSDEIQDIALSFGSKVLITTKNLRLIVVDVSNLPDISEHSSFSVKNVNTFYSASSGTLYYIDSNMTIIYNENTRVIPQLWEGSPLFLTVNQDETIAAISTDKNAIFVLNLQEEELLQRLDTENRPSCCKITANFIVAAHGSSISIWATRTWQLVSVKAGNTQLYTCLDVNELESMIAAGCEEGHLHLWRIPEKNRLPMVYEECAAEIKKVEFIEDSYVFYFSFQQNRLLFLEITDFPREFSTALPPGRIKSMDCMNDELMINIENDGIYQFDIKDLALKDHILRGRDLVYSIDQSKSRIRVSCENKSGQGIDTFLCNLDLNTDSYKYIPKPWGKSCVKAQTHRSSTDHYLMGFANGTLSIMEMNIEKVKDSRLHTSGITAIVCLNSGDFSISGDEEGNVLVYDLDLFCLSGKFKKHRASITALQVSNCDKFLISGSKDGVIRISDVSSRTCSSTIKIFKSAVKQAYISEDFFVACNRDGEFRIWSMSSKTVVSSQENVEAFCFRDENILLAQNGRLLSLHNPLSTGKFTVFGDEVKIVPYFKYLHKILKYKQPPNNPKFNNWLLLPYRLNAMHFYTYFALSKHLSVALSNDTYFVEDTEKHSPLTISLRYKTNIMESLICFLIEKVKNFNGFAYFFNDCLIKITRRGSRYLSELYSCLFMPLNIKKLPEFCDNSVNLPIMIMSDCSYDIKLEEFFSPEKKKVGKSIYFKQFSSKLCLELGSKDSIDLIESLIKSPNSEIFQNDMIGLLLDYKWRIARLIVLAQTIIYFTYLLLLIIYVSAPETKWVFVMMISMSSLTVVDEFYYFYTNGLQYFTNPLNLLELARVFTLVTVYNYARPGMLSDAFLTLLIILSFIRGVSQFRLIKATRYLTYLIIEVTKDMLAFFILFSYSILAVSTIFIAVSSENGSFFSYLEASFIMALGDFSLDEYNSIERVIFVFASIINMIIMLNLLISILGDTFDRVRQDLKEADRIVMAEMILRVEKLVFGIMKYSKTFRSCCFCFSNNQCSPAEKKYFSVCLECKDSRNTKKDWEGNVRLIMNEIGVAKQAVVQNNENLKAMKKEIVDSLKKDLVDSLKKDLFDSLKKDLVDSVKDEMLGTIKKEVIQATRDEMKALTQAVLSDQGLDEPKILMKEKQPIHSPKT